MASMAAASAVPRAKNNPSRISDANLHVNAKDAQVVVPKNFIGLSYETQQLHDPEFFSPSNRGLVSAFREIAPCGVLRLGGNTSSLSKAYRVRRI